MIALRPTLSHLLVAFYENSGTRVMAARESSEYVVLHNVYRHPLKPGAPDIHLLAEREEKAGDAFIRAEDAVGRTRVHIAGHGKIIFSPDDVGGFDRKSTPPR